ncbi:long-chain-fatty-acid--CoA ligase [Bradyrhizobium sp. 1]|uniref:long-chain-fatty-acid--CoA ligase n=1 Tax=Bradyrhizobium sp. 1 TaxID=241591 RepID=UPI001FF90B6A|nr:long-chain-fatty-acid--CoA ligase [Bradyrhizobium sp. 1]MCK1394455.1 long-chain-fatty-acid--CoA ligase [Bradyrhizobium sp. 1]
MTEMGRPSEYKIEEVADITRQYRRIKPDAPAITFEGRTQTYEQLDKRANLIAEALLSKGLGAGDRIAYFAKNSDTFVELYLACAKSHVTLVPINWRLASVEVEYILADSEARLIFVSDEFEATAFALKEKIPGVVDVIGIEGARGVVGLEKWLGEPADVDPKLDVVPDIAVVQMYTSGTTGRPKGALLSNANVVASLHAGDQGALGAWGYDDVMLVALPFFHVGGAQIGLHILHQGGHMVVIRDANAESILMAFGKWPVTRTGLVPAVLQFCLDHELCKTTDFSSLKTVTYGGSPISENLFRRAKQTLGCELIHMFAMTETTAIGTVLLPQEYEQGPEERQRSIGRAAASMQVRVVKPDGSETAPREVGEIVVKGPCVFSGYWKLAEASAQAIRDGWFHTGDAGYTDEAGYLYIHDRIKDMIISGGENVYPAEIENVLSDHPAVKDVAVIGVPDEKWGEAVKAVVVTRTGILADQADVIAFARTRLAGYKVPKSVDFVDELPRNSSGKLLKRLIRAPYWDGRARQVN